MTLKFINILSDLTCGTGDITFDSKIPNITSKIVLAIQIVIPILLVIFGMIDLGKAIIAQKEDDIKKGQQTFIKRLITAAIVFLVVFLVKLVVGLVTDNSDNKNISDCLSCFLNGEKKCTEPVSGAGTDFGADDKK